MNEIGCVKMPMLGRTGTSAPSSIIVCWPMRGAGKGVAGARMASTPSNSSSTSLAIPAAEFLRLDDQRRRHHGAGDQPVAHGGIEVGGARAQAVEVQGGALGGGDDEGGGAGPRRLRGISISRVAPSAAATRATAASASGDAPRWK